MQSDEAIIDQVIRVDRQRLEAGRHLKPIGWEVERCCFDLESARSPPAQYSADEKHVASSSSFGRFSGFNQAAMTGQR